MLGNGGYRLVTNNQGMESGLRRDRNAISGGGGREKRARGWQVFLAIYIANMLKSLKRAPSRPCADGSPQRLPVGIQSVSFQLDHNAELACQDSALDPLRKR